VSEDTIVSLWIDASWRRGVGGVRISTSNGYEIVADEPKNMGGEGLGPTPVELFLASLASCFVCTLRIHARRLGIELDEVSVRVEGSFDMLGFLDVEDAPRGFTKIKLVAKVSSKQCEDLDKLIDLALRTWIVGKTVERSNVLEVVVEKVCSKK